MMIDKLVNELIKRINDRLNLNILHASFNITVANEARERIVEIAEEIRNYVKEKLNIDLNYEIVENIKIHKYMQKFVKAIKFTKSVNDVLVIVKYVPVKYIKEHLYKLFKNLEILKTVKFFDKTCPEIEKPLQTIVNELICRNVNKLVIERVSTGLLDCCNVVKINNVYVGVDVDVEKMFIEVSLAKALFHLLQFVKPSVVDLDEESMIFNLGKLTVKIYINVSTET